MTNRQIQPVRSRDLQIIRQTRPRSLWGQVWTLALQPNTFFEALPRTNSARQWFWVAVLILVLNGLSAVRQEALVTGGTGSDFGTPPVTDFGGDTGGFPLPGGGGFNVSPGGGGGSIDGPGSSIPPDFGSDIPSSPASSADVSSTWITALISGSHILLGWFVLALLLCEVPLFNGVRPSYGQNLQLAIWTSVPLGIMAGLQLIYLAAGGKPGATGLTGLLAQWEGYGALPLFLQSLILSLASRFTVFWVWTLVLVYIGARTALKGKHWAVALVVIAWALVLVVVPVVTGAVAVPALPESTLNEIPLPEQNLFPEASTGSFEVIPGDSNLGAQATLGVLSPGSAVVGEGEVVITPEAGGGKKG